MQTYKNEKALRRRIEKGQMPDKKIKVGTKLYRMIHMGLDGRCIAYEQMRNPNRLLELHFIDYLTFATSIIVVATVENDVFISGYGPEKGKNNLRLFPSKHKESIEKGIQSDIVSQ